MRVEVRDELEPKHGRKKDLRVGDCEGSRRAVGRAHLLVNRRGDEVCKDDSGDAELHWVPEIGAPHARLKGQKLWDAVACGSMGWQPIVGRCAQVRAIRMVIARVPTQDGHRRPGAVHALSPRPSLRSRVPQPDASKTPK